MLTAIVAFVVVIGPLILFHEWGHFVVARLAGVGVERFSIGFGPVLWRFRGKETEYCLSAIPMGGYVKMVGDDENPLEGGGGGAVDPARAFNLKPVWKRFLIVFAGPGMNFVLAVAILASFPMVFGRPMIPSVVGRVVEGGPAAQAGLRAGDRVVAVDGRPVEYWSQIEAQAQDGHGAPLRLTVRRGSEELPVTLQPTRTSGRDALGDKSEFWDLGVRHSSAEAARVGEVIPGMPAARAGLKPGDLVVAVAGQPVRSWEDMAAAINKRAGQPTPLTIRRGEETLTITVTPETVDGVGRIGIGGQHVPSPPENLVYVRSWDPLAAVRDGFVQTAYWTGITLKALWRLVSLQLSPTTLGGPIEIARTAGQQAKQSLASLAFFTAVISVNLAVLNLLPVPMLDGGHLLFFGCEAVLGRPISVRKREVAQQVGFVLLMLLMVYAVYNDLARLDVFRFFR
ncbi:MAG TPA: RIP metalloprotease RseP [Methylomirabilota bacterium]|nr:RIP metalloprotease RseP [Methylomirabilota bacterium]